VLMSAVVVRTTSCSGSPFLFLEIPSIASMFKIDSIQTTIARNKNGEPEQLVVLTTTANINTRELAKALEIKLLPKRKVSEAEKEAEVDSSGEADQPQ